jgi:hypothetical protein
MSLFVLYPFVALIAMIVVLVIMIILKKGPEFLNLRNYTLTRRERPERAYSQPVQYA